LQLQKQTPAVKARKSITVKEDGQKQPKDEGVQGQLTLKPRKSQNEDFIKNEGLALKR